MSTAEPLLTPTLVAVCVLMALLAAVVNRIVLHGSPWAAPTAALRATAQLAAVATVLAVALQRLWSSALVLAVMFAVASVTAARRSQAQHGAGWLAAALASGMAAVIPLVLLTGVVPLTGVAVVPVFGIVLGGTMTASSVAARRALDTLGERRGEVEAALSLGLPERFSRMMVIQRPLSDALIPNLDQARTAGLVTLPGAFVGVLLATGSATQAGAVQVLVLIALLLAQVCGVAMVGELVARGLITRSDPTPAQSSRSAGGHAVTRWVSLRNLGTRSTA